MNLTVEGMTEAILAARNLETLQGQLRDALIERLIQQSPSSVPANNNDRGKATAHPLSVFSPEVDGA